MVRIIGHASWIDFLESGAAVIDALDEVLAAHGLGFAQAESVLDFGCGCGRLIRHLPARTQAALHGSDLNASQVRWCAANLPGRFAPNGLRPPLPFEAGQFDLIYGLSVFTHLRPETQNLWLEELARVTRPGGHVLLSLHDEHQPRANAALKAEVSARGVLMMRDGFEGSNLPAAYQSHAYVREVFARYFDVIDVVRSDQLMFEQGLAVLRRRAD